MKKRKRPGLFIVIAIAIFSVYAAINLISLQLQINEQSSLTAVLAEQQKIVENENAALQAVIDSEMTDDIIAKQAREKLGLAQPGERIFIDTSN